jgi:hypothetical protein
VRLIQRTAVSLVALTVAATPVLMGEPASAAPVGAPAASVAPCLTGFAATARTGGDVPPWRKYADTSSVSQSDLDALPAEQTHRRFMAREVTPKLAPSITIPTYVHVIKGKHKGERVPAGPKRVRQVIHLLNAGMHGKQSMRGTPTRYRFALRHIDYTRRDGWYHAFLNGPRDQRAKRALHRGNARTLNLYINGGGPKDYPVLGWSRFPWQYKSAPYMDGVSINQVAIPGGRATGYNLGDTTIHETGHWLGLFHTFEGGCGSRGDLVLDTPAEAEPSYYCETTRDTCDAPGRDPVRNFMDYSLDRCMTMFTAGQVRRMDSAFEKWRS